MSRVQAEEDNSCLFNAANLINTINIQSVVEAHSGWWSAKLGIQPLTLDDNLSQSDNVRIL